MFRAYNQDLRSHRENNFLMNKNHAINQTIPIANHLHKGQFRRIQETNPATRFTSIKGAQHRDRWAPVIGNFVKQTLSPGRK